MIVAQNLLNTAKAQGKYEAKKKKFTQWALEACVLRRTLSKKPRLGQETGRCHFYA